MTNIKHLIAGSMLIASMAITFANANVYVFGIVIDSLKNPIPDVSIIISRMQGGNQPLDTLTSGTGGKFAQMVVYGQDLMSIRYSASKTGYLTATGMQMVVQDTADLDTIILRNAAAPDSIYVFGLVLDTAKKPVGNVQIVISGGMLIGSVLDTLFSANNGTFAQFVKVSQTFTRVRYIATKNGYLPATAMVNVVRDTANCDTITLRPGLVVSIGTIVRPNTGVGPDRIALYSLNGRLLYVGPVVNANKALKNTISVSQPLIAHYMFDNTVVYTKKVFLTQ